ncbi:DUF2550 domain-containing protein [Lapillicoccus sp.]|uniref:DUF2550 domain-containing protein n=1 Tax=Lapillicoccus sp. TaxID=1909287 RepID=UPI0027C243A6|nr:DUF2550 domain-containing protein [Actinomycetota bacterium]
MPAALVSAEVVVGAFVVLLAVGLGLTFARRLVVRRGRTLTLCAWRARPADRWRVGLMRQGSAELAWFTLLGVSTRPRHLWDRAVIDLSAPTILQRVDHIELIPDAVLVRCSHGTEQFELALATPAYTALRSWAEAAPPGSAANVA